jgi:N-acetyl-gamma-glutamyl-phosphate reductase
MPPRVFIDGEVGTTGLQIQARLANRTDVSLISLPETERKDIGRRRDVMNSVDMVILCLPDDAAREAVTLIESPDVQVIDASSAHRIAEGWVYGMPEYNADQADKIANAKRVTNPGCYAVTAVSIIHPLISAGILSADFPVTINAISGYSGGGKKMIESFEDENSPNFTTDPFRVYGLSLEHKHTEEIRYWSGLANRPLFVPSVGRFRQGMIVQVPLQLWAIPGEPKPEDIYNILSNHYADSHFISVADLSETANMTGLEPEGLNDSNELRIFVFGNESNRQAVVMGLIDNLGKGASAQAVQNMNLMLGREPSTGLEARVSLDD